MKNIKQDIGKALIKRLAFMAIDFYKDEDEIDAKNCWNQLAGAAVMYAELFDEVGEGWYAISVKALTEACEYFIVDMGEFWSEIVGE